MENTMLKDWLAVYCSASSKVHSQHSLQMGTHQIRSWITADNRQYMLKFNAGKGKLSSRHTPDRFGEAIYYGRFRGVLRERSQGIIQYGADHLRRSVKKVSVTIRSTSSR